MEFDQALVFSSVFWDRHGSYVQVRLPKHGSFAKNGVCVCHKPWFMPQLKWDPLEITLVNGLHYYCHKVKEICVMFFWWLLLGFILLVFQIWLLDVSFIGIFARSLESRSLTANCPRREPLSRNPSNCIRGAQYVSFWVPGSFLHSKVPLPACTLRFQVASGQRWRLTPIIYRLEGPEPFPQIFFW